MDEEGNISPEPFLKGMQKLRAPVQVAPVVGSGGGKCHSYEKADVLRTYVIPPGRQSTKMKTVTKKSLS